MKRCSSATQACFRAGLFLNTSPQIFPLCESVPLCPFLRFLQVLFFTRPYSTDNFATVVKIPKMKPATVMLNVMIAVVLIFLFLFFIVKKRNFAMRIIFFIAVYDADFADNLPFVVCDNKAVLKQIQYACRLVVAVASCPVSVEENHFYAKWRVYWFCGTFLVQEAKKTVGVPGLKSPGRNGFSVSESAP